jgi:hypothetical protein
MTGLFALGIEARRAGRAAGVECGGRLREGRVVENSSKKRGGPIDNRLVFVYI